MNKVMLIGRLTRDAQIIEKEGVGKVGKFTLAVPQYVGKDSEPIANFIPCVVFNERAEQAEKYFKKGVKIAIGGYLKSGKYEKNGVDVFTLSCFVTEWEFAESKRDNTVDSNESNEEETAAEKPTPEKNAAGYVHSAEEIAEQVGKLPWD